MDELPETWGGCQNPAWYSLSNFKISVSKLASALFGLIRQQVVLEGFLVMRSVLEAHIFVPRKTGWVCPVQRHQKDNIMLSAKQELTHFPTLPQTHRRRSQQSSSCSARCRLADFAEEGSPQLCCLFLLFYLILTILFYFLGFSSSPTLFFFLELCFICSVIGGRLP